MFRHRRSPRSADESSTSSALILINPLGAALAHYTRVLARTLENAGAEVLHETITEPSSSGRGRIAWLASYVAALGRARTLAKTHHAEIVVTWPVLGFLDLVLLRVFCRGETARLIMHDPVPLVPAVGYSHFSRLLASVVARRRSIVVHTVEAQKALGGASLQRSSVILPHCLAVRHAGSAPHAGPAPHAGRPPHAASRPMVRIIGQYKVDRDIEVLAEIARIVDGAWDLEVRGRGWPAVPGWRVLEGFIEEEDLDDLIRSSSVVLIPYRRFFQSGVAVRSIECATPIVGPSVSALRELCPGRLDVLVSPGAPAEEWVGALRTAMDIPIDHIVEWALDQERHGVRAWGSEMAPSRT